MRALARFVILGRWWVIGATCAFLPLAAIFGGDVAERLSVGGFEDPGAESSRAAETLDERFRAGEPDFVVLVTADDGDIDAPEVTEAGLALTEELRSEPGVLATTGYWDPDLPQNSELPDTEHSPLSAESGNELALVLARLEGSQDEAIEAAEELTPRFTTEEGPISTQITGAAEVAREISEQAEKDLQRSELLTAPVTFVALVLVFGAVVAGLLPLAVGVLAVLGTFVALTVLTGLTDVSVFALNLTTGLGLGLAIDYSLFIVSRYREELGNGVPREVALSRTMQTAGRTVAFSAGTVIVSMLALLAFPILYLRSFAYAGVSVVAFAAVASVIVLPAILAALGPRVEKGKLFHRDHSKGTFWHDQALRVMRRPIPYAVGVTALLLVLAIPFLHLESGQVDDRVIPDSHPSRAATDEIRENFETRESGAVNVLLDGIDPEADADAISAYAGALSAAPNVERVDTITGFFRDGEQLPLPPNDFSEQRFGHESSTWLSVVPDVEPISPEGEQLVADVRAVESPFEDVSVAGPSAALVDTKDTISTRLPIALGVIALTTFVLLFMMVGSLLVPLKALLLNVLSLTATFGGMVWVFQDGHLSDLLGFTPTGTIDVFTPILMFCIAFGLSMDYEVFLLSRIKEEYDLHRDNEAAVAVGLQHTGRIVTAAALLLSIVFVAIATSEVAVVKLFGLGLTVAVLVDAFLIRATLVPAFMRLAGRANWWAPRPLRRFHLRWGIFEDEPPEILDRIEAAGRAGAMNRP